MHHKHLRHVFKQFISRRLELLQNSSSNFPMSPLNSSDFNKSSHNIGVLSLQYVEVYPPNKSSKITIILSIVGVAQLLNSLYKKYAFKYLGSNLFGFGCL